MFAQHVTETPGVLRDDRLRIFRDIPRDPSRTCALEVDVWVTDYTNNEHHAMPEVVETRLTLLEELWGWNLFAYLCVRACRKSIIQVGKGQ